MIELDNDQRAEMGANLSAGYAFWSPQMQAVRDDMAFASGDQWSDEAAQIRGHLAGNTARPMLVTHALRPYINRVINPVRMYPFAIDVKPKRLPKDQDPQKLVEQASKIVKGAVRRCETRSRASEAYELAYSFAVQSGLGYIHVGMDYPNAESMDREPTISAVDDPSWVVLDPCSVAVDGSDAEWGALVKPISMEAARRFAENPSGCPDGMPSIYTGWGYQLQPKTVWEMVYYRKSSRTRTRYRLADGTDTWELLDGQQAIKQRETSENYVECYHFIGDELVEKLDLKCRYIPIIPVQGDRVYLPERKLAGLVHWTRDWVEVGNYYLSSEVEVVGQAPRSVWLLSEGQKEGHEEEWDNNNAIPRPTLTYRTEGYNGQAVSPPQRVDTGANTQPLIGARMAALQDMARTLGISDNAMGRMEAGAESGVAVGLRSADSEIATAHYAQNLAMSVAQTGRVVTDLQRNEGEGVRWVEVENERGEVEEIQIDLKSVFDALGDIDIDAGAGPSYASARRDGVSTMLALGQAMPDRMPAMADIIVRNSDAPGSNEIANRLEKMLPAELRDEQQGVPSGEAKAALDAADATIGQQAQAIDELKNLLMQLQAQIIDNSKDRETDIAKAMIDSRTKLAVEQIKQAGQDGRLSAEIAAEAENALMAQLKLIDVSAPPPVIPRQMPPPAPGPVAFEVPSV